MEPGECRSSRWPGWTPPCLGRLVLLVCLGAGCSTTSSELNQVLLATQNSTTTNIEAAEQYQVACPDVLEWSIDGRPDLTGRQVIGTDGRIDLGPLGKLRVEGHSLAEMDRMLAARAAAAPETVHVKVVEFSSQQIYLFGEVSGSQRAIPYRGQETLLDLLRRVGGITPGAAANEVYVVRSRIAEGQQPEVFRIDLKSILMNQDATTNIRLQPFDQVYVGETRQSSLKKCVPPCLRPLYKTICGLRLGPARLFRKTPPDQSLAQNSPPPASVLMTPNRYRSSSEPPSPTLPMPRRLDSESESNPLPTPRRLDP